MKTKWFIQTDGFNRYKGLFWILPCISLVYNEKTLLESGVFTPSLSLRISFLNFAWGITIQKGY